MCVHVHSLPDDCVLPIFDRVPLSDLIRLDRVCPRWANLLPSARARRRNLVLICGGSRVDERGFDIPFSDTFEVSFDGRISYYDLSVSEHEASLTLPPFLPNVATSSNNKSFDEYFLDDDEEPDGFFDILYEVGFTEVARLQHARADGQLAAYFTDLFPNVHNLIVIHPRCDEKELNWLVDLLGSSSWSLNILKLWIYPVGIDQKYLDRPERHPVGTLLQNINRHSSLQHLTLDIDGDGRGFAFPIETYAFISRLKVLKLFIGWYDCDNKIWDIIHRFGSPQLRHIALGSESVPRGNFVIAGLNPEFEYTSKVGQLYGRCVFETVEQLSELCRRFASLNMLQMHWNYGTITFDHVVSNLASLAHLTHLKLVLFSSLAYLFERVDDDQAQPQVVSLPQVKILEMAIRKHSHGELDPNFESLSSLVFPSVRVIILVNMFSHVCSTCSRRGEQGPIECHRQLVHSLKAKFVNNSVRFYAFYVPDNVYVDWTNHVTVTEQDDDDQQLESGDGDDDQNQKKSMLEEL